MYLENLSFCQQKCA